MGTKERESLGIYTGIGSWDLEKDDWMQVAVTRLRFSIGWGSYVSNAKTHVPIPKLNVYIIEGRVQQTDVNQSLKLVLTETAAWVGTACSSPLSSKYTLIVA